MAEAGEIRRWEAVYGMSHRSDRIDHYFLWPDERPRA
jgi:hypothetical protein